MEEQELQSAVEEHFRHLSEETEQNFRSFGMWKALEGGDSEGFTAWDLQNEAGQG